jgi:hypothetical protein
MYLYLIFPNTSSGTKMRNPNVFQEVWVFIFGTQISRTTRIAGTRCPSTFTQYSQTLVPVWRWETRMYFRKVRYSSWYPNFPDHPNCRNPMPMYLYPIFPNTSSSMKMRNPNVFQEVWVFIFGTQISRTTRIARTWCPCTFTRYSRTLVPEWRWETRMYFRKFRYSSSVP